MAEVLEFNEMFYTNFEPKMKNRFIMNIDGIDSYLIKTANRPTIQFEPVTLDHINVKRKLKGKGEWQDVEITLYDPIVPSGAQQVMEWVRTHFESVSGRAGYADFYKRDCQLKMLDPVGTVVELWDIKGAFLTQAGFGDLSYDGDEPQEISMTLRFDNCVLQY